MNEIKHLGFKYHWPNIEYTVEVRSPNWWINFESKMIYVRSISKIYSFTIVEKDNHAVIIFEDGSCRERTLPTVVFDAYSSYIADKILLEE